MPHRRRLKHIVDVDQFVIEQTAMLALLIGYQSSLDVICPHYDAVGRLAEAVRQAIEDVSGKPPPWVTNVRTSPG